MERADHRLKLRRMVNTDNPLAERPCSVRTDVIECEHTPIAQSKKRDLLILYDDASSLADRYAIERSDFQEIRFVWVHKLIHG
jgi:hypothetical protein